MDRRYLIYEGFKDDHELIFKDFRSKFNFKITDVSDSGIHFVNNRCRLDITYETGIQVWLKIPKYNISEMIPILAMFKGDAIYYKNIVQKSDVKKSMIELSDFLITYFVGELSE